ncbi:MAG: Rpn family recombination-promoting nuclease/putative transposase [Lactobacillales bacterium]|jgi:predicted transposase/invertase (TIGR01784 family)|nr:Rpn family recombination-promoting nuclease/putative transposase [Lactobacillales bacterium]
MNSVTDDLLFKLVFGDERNKRALIHLLSSVVGFKITDVDIRKTEMTPEFIGGKESRLDVLATDDEGRLYNIELQKQNDIHMRERSLFYWSEVFYKQLDKGESYDLLCKTICINILKFKLINDDKFWHTYHMWEDETHELLTDLEEIHFLELPKMKEFSKKNPITWWLEYLKNPHSKVVKQIGEFEPVIKEAVKMFDVITSDKKTQELLRMREKGERDFNSAMKSSRLEGRAEGLEKGIVKGIEKGIEKEKKETALSMLTDGLPVSTISKYTGLSPSEIQSLKSR